MQKYKKNEHDGSALIANNQIIQLPIEKSSADYNPSQKVY
jgi:hypothetical protein